MYNLSVKKYSNNADGVRYNISLSPVSYRKSPYEVDSSVPTSALESVECRVHSREDRDRSSILRSIREIRSLGLANNWDYFVTFTLNPKKCNRTDYPAAVSRMVRYFRYLRSRMNVDIQYLLIPELHVDGKNWHFHGLMSGIPQALLAPHPLRWQREKGYLDFPEFSSRFGFVSLSPVNNVSAVVYYCLKYINKSLFCMRQNDGMRLYYVSRGLKRPIEVLSVPVECSRVYLANNLEYTEYTSAYSRGLDVDTLHSVLSDIFFENLYEVNSDDYSFPCCGSVEDSSGQQR